MSNSPPASMETTIKRILDPTHQLQHTQCAEGLHFSAFTVVRSHCRISLVYIEQSLISSKRGLDSFSGSSSPWVLSRPYCNQNHSKLSLRVFNSID